MEEELNTQIEELNFTINSLKMDYDAMNDQNTKKIITLRKLNN
jgi:outer membrane murein-binding lipoprotein Lpp